MTARAVRLERGFLVTLRMLGFSGLRDEMVSQRGVASTVATLLRTKGLRGF